METNREQLEDIMKIKLNDTPKDFQEKYLDAGLKTMAI